MNCLSKTRPLYYILFRTSQNVEAKQSLCQYWNVDSKGVTASMLFKKPRP